VRVLGLLNGPIARFQQHTVIRRIATNSGWLLADQALRMGVGLFVGIWVARYLGPTRYGQLNYAVAFVALFGAFATLGMSGVVVRELILKPDDRNAIVATAFALKLIGALVGIGVTLTAALLLNRGDDTTTLMVCVIASGLLFQSLDAIDLWFQSQLQAKYTVYARAGAFILVTGGRITLLLQKADVMAFAWAAVAEAALAGVGLLFAYRSAGRGISLIHVRSSQARYLISQSWPLFLSGMAILLYVRLDVVMLGRMIGQREAGIYSAATRLSEMWYFIPMLIVSSVAPAIVESFRTNASQYIARLRKLYFLMAWLAIAVSLPLSLLSTPVVTALFGVAFREAGPVLAIHLWASIAVFLGVASSQHLLVAQLQTVSFYRTLIGLLANVLLNLFLIPRFGARGAAVATVISYFISTFSLVLFARTRSHAALLFAAPFRWRDPSVAP
jgi:polysaccharide transporter, PST family